MIDQQRFLSMSVADALKYVAQQAAIDRVSQNCLSNQIDQIDDYIESQLAIQTKSREIEKLTRNGEYLAAYEANRAMQAASQKLGNWLWKHMKDSV